jgi:hypothetical protein
MSSDRMRRRLKRYVRAYYEALRGEIARYSTVQDAFPAFLTGSKKVIAFVCADGVLVSHWSAEHDSFGFRVRTASVGEVVREISGPGF